MAQQAKDENSQIRLFDRMPLSDRFLVAALPVVAYALVFIYKVGYYGVFELPVEFITLSMVDVLIGVGALLALCFTLVAAINAVFSFLPKDMPASLEWRFELLTPPLVIVLALFFLYTGLWKEWLLPLILLTVLGLILFVPPLHTKGQEGSYLEKLGALDRSRAGDIWEDTRSLVYWATRSLRPSVLALITYGLVGLYVVYHGGRASAVKQQVFRVASTSPETVVLVMNQEWMICAPFDRTTQEVEPSFIMLQVPGQGNVEFRLEKIGPLRLRKDIIAQTAVPSPTLTDAPTPTPTVALTHTPSATRSL